MRRVSSNLEALIHAAQRAVTGAVDAAVSAGEHLIQDVDATIGGPDYFCDVLLEKAHLKSIPNHVPKNPVHAPDPSVLRVGSSFFLTHTGENNAGTFPILESRDLVHWKAAGAIFPKSARPCWLQRTDTANWAPEIHKVGKGFVAYFTARDMTGHLCLGAATSRSVRGPYQDIGHPLLRNPHVGVIDPTFFRDRDGAQYVLWKEESNLLTPPKPTNIVIQRVSADGTQLKGRPRALIHNDRSWEGPLVEGPELTRHGDFYYLFYAANTFDGHRYVESVARARSPFGPYEKLGRPLLRSTDAWRGPGHGSFFSDTKGQDHFAYHAHPGDGAGLHNPRYFMVANLTWGADAWPRIGPGAPGTEVSL